MPADRVPRLLLWDPELALAQAYAARANMIKSLHWIEKGLTSLGFVIVGADSSPTRFAVARWGLMVDQLILTFLQAKEAFAGLGAWEKSSQAEEYARMAYKIVIGEDATFSATYS